MDCKLRISPGNVVKEFQGEVNKIKNTCSTFPQGVACQMLLISVNVSQRYLKKGDFLNTL